VGPTDSWSADSLYFPGTGKARKLKGYGSMTRDGGIVFMRIGVHAPGTPDLTGGRVGAYDVKSGKTEALPGVGVIYGNDAFRFSAFDQASRRGRYVVNQTTVVDRKTGQSFDITAALAANGLQPYAGFRNSTYDTAYDEVMRRISGDGKVVIAPTANAALIDNDQQYWLSRQDVAVTNWQGSAG
jgi:hypothetical protein